MIRKFLIFLGIFIVAIAVALVVHIREQSDVRDRHARLYELGMALHAYHSHYGHFPPVVAYEDGVPMHSWRVLLMEFHAPELFAQYRLEEPWDSPHNSKLTSQMPRCFRREGISEKNGFRTFYVAPCDKTSVLLSGLERPRESQELFTHKNRKSIMLVELPETAVPWMSLQDGTSAEIVNLLRLSHFSDDCHFLTTDGSVEKLSDVSLDELMMRLQVQRD